MSRTSQPPPEEFSVEAIAAAYPELIRALSTAHIPKIVTGATIRRADSIKRTSPGYLWYPYLPKGELASFVGEGDSGKTWLWAIVAVAVTTGGSLPADPKSRLRKRPTKIVKPADVILIQRENSEGATIIPRFEDMGGDLSRLIIPDEPFNFVPGHEKGDLESYLRLAWYIKMTGAALVTFDPITGFVAAKLSDASEVRTVLERLQIVARFGNTTIPFVAHLNKNYEAPIKHRVMGSVEFFNVPRACIVVSQDPDGEQSEDHSDHVIFHEKNNVGQKGGPIGFTILGHPASKGETRKLDVDNNLEFRWREVDSDRTAEDVQKLKNGEGEDEVRTKPGQIRDILLKNLYAADKNVFTTDLKDRIAEEMGYEDGIPHTTWAMAVRDLPFKGFEAAEGDVNTEQEGSGRWAWRPVRLEGLDEGDHERF